MLIYRENDGTVRMVRTPLSEAALAAPAGSVACDPFLEAKQIRAGKRDEERPEFEVLTGWLQRVPITWLPSLLVRIVTHCIKRKVFKDAEALLRTVKRVADQAGDDGEMMRESQKPPNR